MTSHSPTFRIAHVISAASGVAGAERLLAALVEQGRARGHRQLVLNPFVRDSPPPLEPFFACTSYEPYPFPRASGLPGLRRWLHARLRAFGPEIVHAMLPRATVVVATLPRLPGAKLLLTHAYGEGIRQARPAWARERIDRWAGRRFDRVVAISSDVERYLVSRCHYPSSKVVRITPGWHGEPLVANRDCRPPTVVCVAKLRPEKGHDILLAAFRLVRREVPDARLILVGEGRLKPALEALARDLDIDDSVDFVGEVPDVWPYLSAADVFALASRSEAFGIAIAEAMAAGLPVVAPAVGGIPGLVSPGVSGQLFPKEDHVAMAGYLVPLLTSPGLRNEMGTAARQAAQSLRIEKTVTSYFSLYEQLVERGEHVSDAPDDP